MPKGRFVFVAVVVLGFLSRALPHPHNFTPILAMALVAGAFAERRWVAIALPVLAMALSDLVLNNTVYASYFKGFAGLGPIIGNAWTYAALIVLGLLPRGLSPKRRTSWTWLTALAFGGTALFFLLSNFGVWLGSGMYSQTGAGLLACYTAGLPFLPATLISTLAYGMVAVAMLRGVGLGAPRDATGFALSEAR